MTGVAVLVLSLAAALYTWYQTLSLSARNQDGPWFSIMLGVLVMLGGSVVVPPFDTPVGRIAVLSDPQGAMFSVIKNAPPA